MASPVQPDNTPFTMTVSVNEWMALLRRAEKMQQEADLFVKAVHALRPYSAPVKPSGKVRIVNGKYEIDCRFSKK
jgi:hypothetical protein